MQSTEDRISIGTIRIVTMITYKYNHISKQLLNRDNAVVHSLKGLNYQELANYLDKYYRYVAIVVYDKEVYTKLFDLSSAMILLDTAENMLQDLIYDDTDSLPKNYKFRFGKYTGYFVYEVPTDYIEWFKNNIPKSKW